MWSGRRFGVTREQVTRGSGVLLILTPAANYFSPVTMQHPIASSFTIVWLMLINGYFAAMANLRGLRLLHSNENWGAYTNWEEWRWLRLLTLFMIPPNTLTLTAQLMDGGWYNIQDLIDSACLLVMFYSITVNELPPKQPRARTMRETSHVGAH